VKAGDLLRKLEVTKMEKRALAEPDGVIDRVMAPPGTQVEVKDLLVVFG